MTHNKLRGKLDIPAWQALLDAEQDKDYFRSLLKFVAQRREEVKVFPPQNEVFSAFELCPANNVKVVILGQDPYHGEGQAHGLCFSVCEGVKIPPSLRNIYKELASDIPNFNMPSHGDLRTWAKQGVLLLNTVLTVEEGNANSHKGKGWETFTDNVIRFVSNELQDVIFLLWGKPAQQKASLIDASKHHILSCAHPSPLSAHRGFLGCKHFSETNRFLKTLQQHPINWQV